MTFLHSFVSRILATTTTNNNNHPELTIITTSHHILLSLLISSLLSSLSTYALLIALGWCPLYFGPELQSWHKNHWGTDAISFMERHLTNNQDGYRLYRPLESTRNFLTPGGVALPTGIRRVLFFSRIKLILRGMVYFGSCTEGPPRNVHGGAIAAFVDAALGVAAYRTARMPCLTAQLIINYRKKVELGKELGIECRHISTEGRKSKFQFKLFSLTNEDDIYSDGEATFVNAIAPSRKTGLPPFLALR
jgi:hypothetical protein